MADGAAERGIPLVVGTTGFEPEQKRTSWRRAAATIPLLISSNFSKAVNLLLRLAGEAARPWATRPTSRSSSGTTTSRRTPPSGTALRLAEVVGQGDRLRPVRPRPERAGRRAARGARSACTPSGPATTRASTRSSSA